MGRSFEFLRCAQDAIAWLTDIPRRTMMLGQVRVSSCSSWSLGQRQHPRAPDRSPLKAMVFLWMGRWASSPCKWRPAAMGACIAINSWQPTNRAVTGKVEGFEAVEVATIGRIDLMRRTVWIPTIRAGMVIPIEVENSVDAVAVTRGSHRGTSTLLEIIAAESMSYFRTAIMIKTRATAMAMIGGIHMARSGVAFIIKAHTTRRPSSGTLKKTGTGDEWTEHWDIGGEELIKTDRQ